MRGHRGSRNEPEEPEDEPDELDRVDLHGLPPERALRKLVQDLHAARVRRRTRVLVITGRGLGNRLQQPVLRTRIEQWLRSTDGERAGVLSFTLESRGGALLVRLRGDGRTSGASGA